MLRRSTASSVACEHKNRLLVNTRIPCYPLAVSPWHGSLAIYWMLAVSPWEYSIAIRSLSRHGKTPSPSAVSPWEDSLTLCSLAIAVGQVPTGRLPVGKPPCYPLVACCIAVQLLCLRNETPQWGDCLWVDWPLQAKPSQAKPSPNCAKWGRRLARSASRRPPVC
jgi:hypothetical protein